MTARKTQIDYEQCVAYYRAGRRITGAAAIERYLSANPRTAERAVRDAEHDLALAQRYDTVLSEPIPPRLLHGHNASPTSWLAGAGLVAMIGLSAAGGWWLHGLEFGAAAPAARPNTFGQQVARLTNRQPVVDAAARVATRPTQPDLSRAGYRFSGQHIVPTAGGESLTAYDYRNAAGKQVTIYARPQSGAGRTPPDLISPSGVSLARWQAHGHDYALTGDLPAATLNELAEIATQPPDQGSSGQRTPTAPTVKEPKQRQAPSALGRPVKQTSASSGPTTGL